ncbi:coumarin 8-geranyltransferase 1b, chloroplastic-like isoform X2 [Macadamia integrifolia]|uniref:coumarin 8-geranyltransferase 1b, chloroplastic-like isoform X2 n=1 Tax=Macadamia integrifolia TaxID=60698 RepID=UPI001C4F348B|nr:coumarin 8-geranyltransferase 1b, chloroplastic-like isoform X2 [Macadamia integrifolia]
MFGLGGSSFSLRAVHPSNERGWLSREHNSLKGSFVVPLQVQVNHKNSIQKKWYPSKHFQYYSQRSYALVNNEGNVEKQSYKQDRLEHDYSSKHEDVYNGQLGKLYALYRFTRPYAVMSLGVAITSASCLPVETISEISPTFLVEVLKAFIPTFLAHIYVVGINQLYDLEIDKANKKRLPIASGVLPIGTAKAIVLIATLLSLSMGVMSKSPALLCGILASLMYGTIYSVDLPFLRWKRDPILTAAITGFWCGIGNIIPYFIHAQKYILGKPIIITKSLIFGSAVMYLHGIAISIFKDIPDVDGDKQSSIITLSVRLGKEKAFSLGINTLLIAYGLGMIMGISSSSSLLFKLTTILGQSAIAAVLLLQSRTVDLTAKLSVQSFFMLIWKLVSAEYLLLQFAR